MAERLLLSAILIGLMMTTSQAQVPDSREKILLAYYPSWLAEALPPAAIDFKLFTHIAHAFLLAKADGTPVITERVPDAELTAAAHAAGVKVIISLGGWGSDSYYAPMIRSEEAMRRHVEEVVRIVGEYGYDGVDLDWEHPDDAVDRKAFSFLAKAFRMALDELGERDGRGYELSAAVNPSAWAGQWLDEAVLRETMDYLNIMTYDFSGPWGDHANHHSPLRSVSSFSDREWPSVESGMRYWWEDKSFPRNRLNVGIPLYGRGFEGTQPCGPNPGKGKRWRYSEFGFSDVPGLIKTGWTREWDEKAGIPWLYSPDRKDVAGYDDPESIAGKTRWAKENGFRGVFFWALGHDRMADKSQPLLEAAAKAFGATHGR